MMIDPPDQMVEPLPVSVPVMVDSPVGDGIQARRRDQSQELGRFAPRRELVSSNQGAEQFRTVHFQDCAKLLTPALEPQSTL